MSVHHKIHDYFHNTPITGKLSKKHLPYPRKKYDKWYRFPQEDYQSIHKIMSHICRRFVGKSIKELHQYVINSDYYKYNPSFILEYKGIRWKTNLFKKLTKSSKDNPAEIWSKEEYEYYLDENNIIRDLPCNYGNTKVKTPKNPYRWTRVQFVDSIEKVGKEFIIYNNACEFFYTDSIDPLMRTYKTLNKNKRLDYYIYTFRGMQYLTKEQRIQNFFKKVKHHEAISLEEARKIPYLCKKYNLFYTGDSYEENCL